MGFFKAPHKLHKKAASAVVSLGKKGPHSLVGGSGKKPAPAAVGQPPMAGARAGAGMGMGMGARGGRQGLGGGRQGLGMQDDPRLSEGGKVKGKKK